MAKKGSKFTNYPPEFKIQVVEDYLSGKSGGMPSIVKKYGLKSDSQVLTWTRKYREDPVLLTQDLRGRKSTGRPKSTNLDEMTIEEQNAFLRMENDILKTLRTLLRK
ncbi:transposase [Streptococcus ruminantium]|uniref:Transposase n=4 Tax=Streptococcus ruminantium TaxID=1917441 RepID=A0ABU1B4K6_9STRE|nr:transposase [Streptococcus ruminantium]MDQ8759408.1 transposase [Streptococcus ruminantium]MDQ8769490.1 transposase [Streptococcus ruminantium]MDQ8775330.1 transposase [Streptococcus ruminantium]MDQ8793539.1 transposase [Streptococcus ruminantium]MDQ8796035.1 transposase [Streptococcus ruminantium]